MQIHWYPGHMVKTRKMIRENVKLVDIVLKLVDARAPKSSELPDIRDLIGNKKMVYVLNKADLADKTITDQWQKKYKNKDITTVAVDTLSRNGLKDLLNLIKRVSSKKRPIRCMIIGVPNVGKSSMINQLARRKSAKTADVPGVTRSKMWLKVRRELELLDTPGILWPKFSDKATGIKLALLGCIKPELLNMEQLSLLLLQFLSKVYPGTLKMRYKIHEDEKPGKMLEELAKNRGFLMTGEILDLERAAHTLISEFRQGKLGRISLEKPCDKEGIWEVLAKQDNI